MKKNEPIRGSFGETVKVTCKNGYDGGGQWKCEDDKDEKNKGKFVYISGSGEKCIAKSCKPTQFENSNSYRKGSIKAKFGDKPIKVQCNAGYNIGCKTTACWSDRERMIQSWKCILDASSGGVKWKGKRCLRYDCNKKMYITDTETVNMKGLNSHRYGGKGQVVALTCGKGFVGGGKWRCDGKNNEEGKFTFIGKEDEETGKLVVDREGWPKKICRPTRNGPKCIPAAGQCILEKTNPKKKETAWFVHGCKKKCN